MNQSQPEWRSEVRALITKYVESKTGQVHLLTKLDAVIGPLLLKARTAEQERVVGIIDNVPSEKLIQTLIDRGYTKIEELTD